MNIYYLADYPKMIPQIARWYFDEWGCREADNSYEATVDRLSQKLNRDTLPVPIVAIDEEKLVGTAQLKLREMDIFPEREYWLGGVYVAPDARGNGVGSALAKRIYELAGTFNIDQLWLQTKAIDGGLYVTLGWKIVEGINHNGEDIVVMVKDIGLKQCMNLTC